MPYDVTTVQGIPFRQLFADINRICEKQEYTKIKGGDCEENPCLRMIKPLDYDEIDCLNEKHKSA